MIVVDFVDVGRWKTLSFTARRSDGEKLPPPLGSLQYCGVDLILRRSLVQHVDVDVVVRTRARTCVDLSSTVSSEFVAGGVVRLVQHERHPGGPTTVDLL